MGTSRIHQRGIALGVLFFFLFQPAIFGDVVSDAAAILSARVGELETRWGGTSVGGVPSVALADSIRMNQKIRIRQNGRWLERSTARLYASGQVYPNLLDLDQVELRRGDDGMSFILVQSNLDGPVAEHEFILDPADGKISALEMDREFIRVLTDKGRLLTVSMLVGRSGFFNHSVPLVHNLSLPESILATIQSQSLKLFSISRARRPPAVSSVHPNFFTTEVNSALGTQTDLFRLEAGDDFIFSAEGVLLGHIPTSLLRLQHMLTLGLVELRSEMGAPAGGDREAYSRLRHEMPVLQAAASLLAETPNHDQFLWSEWAETYSKIESSARGAFAHIVAGEPSSVLGRVKKAYAEPELRYENVEPKATDLSDAIDRGDLRPFWKYAVEVPRPNQNLVNWLTTGKRPVWISGAIGFVITCVALARLGADPQAAELLKSLSVTLSAAIPDVLLHNPKNWGETRSYWAYLLPSMAFLAFFSVPLLQTIGAVTAEKLGGKSRGLDFKRGLGQFSLAVYSRLTRAWYLHLINLVPRAATLSMASQNGISPFAQITPESEMGKRLGLRVSIRPGVLNDPETLPRQEAIELRKMVIGEILLNQERGFGFASLIALLETCAAANDERLQSPQAVMDLLRNKSSITDDMVKEALQQFETAWKLRSLELSAAARELSDQGVLFSSPLEMAREQFEQMQSSLVSTSKELNQSGRMMRAMREVKAVIMKRALPWLSRWGLDSQAVLRNNFITRSIANQTWLASRTDLLFGVFLTSLVGGRADFNDAGQLAADPHKPWLGYTSGPNASDSFEQVMGYGISAAARDFLLWFKRSPLREDRHDPVETGSVSIEEREVSVRHEIEGGLRALFSPAGLQKLGRTMWAGSVTNRIEFLWASITLGLIPRVILADKSVGDALIGDLQVLMTCVSFNAFWWVTAILNFGAEGAAGENREALVAAIAQIHRGVALNDKALLTTGTDSLRRLYSVFPPEFRAEIDWIFKSLRGVDGFSEVGDLDIRAEQFSEDLLEIWRKAAVLRQAGVSEDQLPARLKASLEALSKKVLDDVNTTTARLPEDPAELARLAAEKPPVATRPNWLVPELNVWILGAVGSNLVGSYVMADSYGNASLKKLLIISAIYFPALTALRWSLSKLPNIVQSLVPPKMELALKRRAFQRQIRERQSEHPLFSPENGTQPSSFLGSCAQRILKLVSRKRD